MLVAGQTAGPEPTEQVAALQLRPAVTGSCTTAPGAASGPPLATVMLYTVVCPLTKLPTPLVLAIDKLALAHAKVVAAVAALLACEAAGSFAPLDMVAVLVCVVTAGQRWLDVTVAEMAGKSVAAAIG